MTLRTKILIVDDEPAIRRLLRVSLVRGGYEVVEAADARKAMNALEIDKPDLVLLDLGLPDRDGMELVPLIKEAGIALLIVSARDATEEKVTALDLGADDFVTKPFDTEEVNARIRVALRSRLRAAASEAVVHFRDVEVDLAARMVRKNGVEVHLSPKEYGFLAELCRYPGKVISHTRMLRVVWGAGHDDDLEYLRVAARGVRRKLEEGDVEQSAIRNEPGVGYRLQK